MSFDMGGGQMGLSFGFDFDDNSVSQVERAITDVASSTDRLAMSEANLGRVMMGTQQQWNSATTSMQSYAQALMQTSQQQQQFQQNSQQSISILSGAGTSAQQAAQQYTSFKDALGGMQQQIAVANRDIGEHNTLQENLAGTTQTSFEKVQALGSAFGQAAGSITGLIFSSYSLQRAQFQVHRVETQLELQQNKLEDQTAKLAKATLKYGADSEQVAAIQEDMRIQTQKVADMQERARLVEENYDHQLLAFATTTGPLVISTVSSVTQGITSMGDILKISRTDVMNFIGAWGPWMVVGGAVIAIAVDVASSLQQIQKANEDLAVAIATHDWAGALEARINKLKGITEHPTQIIGQALFTLTGQAGNVSGFDLLKMEQDEQKILEQAKTFGSQFKDFMNSPEFTSAFALPPGVTAQIEKDNQHLLELLSPDNYAINTQDPHTHKFSQAYADTWLKAIKDGLKILQTDIASVNAEAERVLTSGTDQERMTFLGIGGSAAEEKAFQLELSQIKGHTENALLIYANYYKRLDSGAVKGWDQYIQTVTFGTDAEKQEAAKMVEEREKNLGIVNDIYDQQMKSSSEHTNAIVADLQKLTEEGSKAADEFVNNAQKQAQAAQVFREQLNIMNQLSSAYFGVRLEYQQNLEAQKLGTSIELKRRQGLLEENKGLIENAKNVGVNSQTLINNVAVLKNDSGALVDNAAAMMRKNQTIKDAVIAEGNYFKILDQSVESEYARSDAIYQATQSVTDFVTKTVLSTIKEKEQLSILQGITQAYGIQIPAGIELTIADYESLIAAQLKTGDTTKALAEIHNKAFAQMHKNIQDVVDAAVKGGKDWREAWKDLVKEGAIPKGLQGFVRKFFEDVADVQQKLKPLEDTVSIIHALADAGVKLKDSQIDKFSDKLTKGLRDVKDELNDFYDKNLVGAVFNPLIDLSKQDLSFDQLAALAAQIDKVNTALSDGTTASELSDLAIQTRNFASAVAAPGEPGSPEAGATGMEVEEMIKTGALQGSGKTPMSAAITQIGNATTVAAGQVKSGSSVINVAMQSSQTAAANFAIQGSNSVSMFVSNIRPHVITIQTYFAKTIAGAINAASKELIAFASLASKIGMGGGTGGGGFTRVGLGIGDFGSGFGKFFDDIFGKDPDFANLWGFLNPKSNGRWQEMSLDTGKGNKKSSPVAGTFQKDIMAMVAGFKVVEVESQKLQTSLANLANEGSNSLAMLSKTASAFATSMTTYLRRTLPIAAQASQTALANLSNEGVDSIATLSQTGSKFATSMNTYLRRTVPVAAQASQTSLANLSNEGSKSISSLNKSASSDLSKLARVVVQVTKDVNALEKAISGLKSKSITITAKKAGDGWAFVKSQALGGIWDFVNQATGGIMSAQEGNITMSHGPQLVLFGDNPGGEEIHAFIPMNNPLPTLRSLQKVLAGKGVGNRGSTQANEGFGGGGDGGTEVINLYINEEKMMTWIRKKLLRNRQGA